MFVLWCLELFCEEQKVKGWSRSYEYSIGGMDFEKSKCSDNRGVQKIAVETRMEDVMRHQSHKDMYWQMPCATLFSANNQPSSTMKMGWLVWRWKQLLCRMGGRGNCNRHRVQRMPESLISITTITTSQLEQSVSKNCLILKCCSLLLLKCYYKLKPANHQLAPTAGS